MTPEKLQEMISNNELEKVIAILQDGNNWIPESARHEILFISNELRQLRQQEIRGIISNKKAAEQEVKIQKSLNLLIEQFFNFNTTKRNTQWQKIKLIILGGLMFIFIAIILWGILKGFF